MSDRPPVHVLYENADWLPPLLGALQAEGLATRLHPLKEAVVDGARAPEPGIWLNRMSPSAATRGNGDSIALMREVLAWLEDHGRRVVNGARVFELEISKLRQDAVLRKHGILTPRTVLAVGAASAVEAAATFDGPFLTKHNQGGKGLGIALYRSAAELEAALDQAAQAAQAAQGPLDGAPNGQIVLQAYIAPREPFVTRVELVGGRFLFAMRSSTTGGFELCPSDVCQAERAPDVCPADGAATFVASPLQADDAIVRAYEALCVAEGIDVAGIEFVEGADGRRYTYDINANTNYNAALGRELGVDGMREVARWLRTI